MAKSVYDRQVAFLESFTESLSCAQACRAISETYASVQGWRRNDTNGFKSKYMVANERRLDNLEERMFNVIEWATREENFKDALRYPTLLMFALKAGRPMYRDSVQAATGAADLLAAISKLSDDDESPTQVDSPVDEGSKRPLERSIPLTTAQEQRMKSKLDSELRLIVGEDA